MGPYMDVAASYGTRTCSRHPGKVWVTACYIVRGGDMGSRTQHGTQAKSGLRRVTNPMEVVKGLRPITYRVPRPPQRLDGTLADIRSGDVT